MVLHAGASEDESAQGQASGGAIGHGPDGPLAARPVSHRLGGVDGLRALAAFWVVLFHIRAGSRARLTGISFLDLFIRSGSTGVSLFLVLSGFCLYIPYAGGKSSRFRTRRFLTRRCRRLLPAYCASLAVIVAFIAIAHGWAGFETHTGLDLLGQTLAHLALVHQLFPSSFYAVNGAYWSLGLEWELYLILPFIILGVRRLGLLRTVAIVIGINMVYRLGLAVAINGGLVASRSLLATAVLPNLVVGRVGEFALGVVAAELYVTGRLGGWARHLRYAVLIVIPVALLTVGNPLNHLLFGAVFFTLLCVVLAGDNIVARVASWSPLVVLGTMSYSIYLVHQPVVGIMVYLLKQGGAGPQTIFYETVALIPLIVAIGWVLFVTVERRTVTKGSFAGMQGESLLMLTAKPSAASAPPGPNIVEPPIAS